MLYMHYTIHCAKAQAIHHFGNQPTIISGTLELECIRNLARPIMLVVAGFYEDDPILLTAGVAKELHHPVAVGQLQPVVTQVGAPFAPPAP